VIDIVVSILFMGFGNNKAIVSFYFGLPFLCLGSLIAVSVKINYNRADRYAREPDPPFYMIRNVFQAVKEAGALKTVTTVVTSVLSGLLAVLLIICGYYAYNRSAILHFPDYVKNETKYNEYYKLWCDLRENDDQKAHDIYVIMEQYHNDNAFNRMRILSYENKLKNTGKWVLYVGIVDLLSVAALVSVRVYFRKREKNNYFGEDVT
jgi:hypothetical protein